MALLNTIGHACMDGIATQKMHPCMHASMHGLCKMIFLYTIDYACIIVVRRRGGRSTSCRAEVVK